MVSAINRKALVKENLMLSFSCKCQARHYFRLMHHSREVCGEIHAFMITAANGMFQGSIGSLLSGLHWVDAFTSSRWSGLLIERRQSRKNLMLSLSCKCQARYYFRLMQHSREMCAMANNSDACFIYSCRSMLASHVVKTCCR